MGQGRDLSLRPDSDAPEAVARTFSSNRRGGARTVAHDTSHSGGPACELCDPRLNCSDDSHARVDPSDMGPLHGVGGVYSHRHSGMVDQPHDRGGDDGDYGICKTSQTSSLATDQWR